MVQKMSKKKDETKEQSCQSNQEDDWSETAYLFSPMTPPIRWCCQTTDQEVQEMIYSSKSLVNESQLYLLCK